MPTAMPLNRCWMMSPVNPFCIRSMCAGTSRKRPVKMPTPPRNDVAAVAGEVPREPGARLDVVGVLPACRRHLRAGEVGVVALRVEVVSHAEVQRQARGRPQLVCANPTPASLVTVSSVVPDVPT